MSVDVRQVVDVETALAPFNEAGVLGPVDVHVAQTLCRLRDETDPDVLLAAALAVRATRHGHVCADLRTVATTVTVDDDLDLDPETDLPWPEADGWLVAVAGSPLTATDGAPEPSPLTLSGGRLYLDRYWNYEQRLLRWLRRHGSEQIEDVDRDVLEQGLDRLFGPAKDDRQRLGAATAVSRPFSILAGGPGTGKTWTVARIAALVVEQALATGARPPRIALAAPTGKAAARLEEEVHEQAGKLDADPAVLRQVASLEAVTCHRLLGGRPGRTRFRHDATDPLPHDTIILDETSMVSLSLMAKLVDAVRPDSRLVLVGDPDQLQSVEAGAVLGDLVGIPDGGTGPLESSTTVLERVHRFEEGSGIAEFAALLRRGDEEAVCALLDSDLDDLRWIRPTGRPLEDVEALAPVREDVERWGSTLATAALAGDAEAALDAVGRLRILCAHRRGPAGVSSWVPAVRSWLESTGSGWYAGRPVMVTANDYRLGLYNGDVGVTVATRGPDGESRLQVAFEGDGGPRLVSPVLLDSAETVYATTVHKSQGSQYEEVVVVLPSEPSPILTRELLYTAVTRARTRVTIVAPEGTLRESVRRRVQRASGLREALW